ncbi:MAG TPA: HD-GYP domain-containing protein, partial [bacterium]|nr:HD-GYP domain-containing protein [bacterium]
RVASISEKIAIKMGLPEKKVKILRETALLHDIGKLGIGEHILQKTEPLTEEEWKIIKTHPVVGEEILRPVFFEKDAMEIVKQHHERFDGKGYPDGLDKNDINLLARILSVADAFDAMTSARAYRKPLSIPEAMKELKANSGTQFDPDIVNTFLKILEEEMHELVG